MRAKEMAAAHKRAGLERHVEIAVRQPLAPSACAACADRQHLGMRGHVVKLARAVAGRGEDLAVAHQHRADRDLAAARRPPPPPRARSCHEGRAVAAHLSLRLAPA